MGQQESHIRRNVVYVCKSSIKDHSRLHASDSSNLGFLSTFSGSASTSALRFDALESSGAFFFFLTIDVKSFTTFDEGVVDEEATLSSWSSACAAMAGALVPNDSFGAVFNSSTWSYLTSVLLVYHFSHSNPP